MEVKGGSARSGEMSASSNALSVRGRQEGLPDVHADHPAVVVELRQAAAPVGAHGNVRRRCRRSEVAAERGCCVDGPVAVCDRERRDIDDGARAREFECFLEQRLAPIDVRRIENASRQFRLAQNLAYRRESARAVADVQVQDAGLARDQPGDVRIARDAQQLVESRLAGAMVADRQFADADDGFHEHDVVAHAAGQRHGRHMVAAGMAKGTDALLAQRTGLCDQRARVARCVVGAEHADDTRDAGAREARYEYRRHPARKTRFSAATGDVRVSVDQAGHEPAAAEIDEFQSGRTHVVRIVDHPEYAAGTDEYMAQAEVVRRVHVGVGE